MAALACSCYKQNAKFSLRSFSVDPLSDILTLLRIESVLSARLEARGPHAFRYPAYSHMKFGGVIEGDCWIWVDGEQPVRLIAGDFYLLTDGRCYCVATDLNLEPIDGATLFAANMGVDGIVRFGEAGDRTVAAAGKFTFADHRVAGLLSFLPALIHIPRGSPGSEPLTALLPLLGSESEGSAPGSSLAASSLASLILVQIIRAYLAKAQFLHGWLGALTDPQMAKALSLIHGDLRRRWTVALLAHSVGMSRTAFSQCFKQRIGRSPLNYLTHWRMMVAAALLKGERRSVADVAEAVGYGSDTAFSTAFKRTFGISPTRFRLYDTGPQARASV